MSLIEQYGSYEKASKACDKEIKDGGYPHDLVEGLLEYRRANNIFEGDDYIVWLFGYEPSHLYKVKYITDKGYSYGNDWGWYGVLSKEGVGHDFRHATELEIKAGYRL